MTSIATNAANDIYRDASGNLALVSGIDAVAQDSVHAMATVLGECVLDTTQGLPYDQTIWDRYKPAQFESAARRTLLAVPGVTAVQTFTMTRQGETASYTATLKTVYGITTISGVIPNG